MPWILWVPLVSGVLWLAVVRSEGRMVPAVRVVAGTVSGVVLIFFVVAALGEPAGSPGVPLFGLVAVGTACGLAGIVSWSGRTALVMRWVGLSGVVAAMLLGAGLVGVAVGLFYVPALQRVQTGRGTANAVRADD
jgi:hypothetical protein